jgi:hypothetical protein
MKKKRMKKEKKKDKKKERKKEKRKEPFDRWLISFFLIGQFF